jgi:hypothetical protein
LSISHFQRERLWKAKKIPCKIPVAGNLVSRKVIKFSLLSGAGIGPQPTDLPMELPTEGGIFRRGNSNHRNFSLLAGNLLPPRRSESRIHHLVSLFLENFYLISPL